MLIITIIKKGETMENLHLKNLKNQPTGYIILQKLYNEKQQNYDKESYELREQITLYINDLTFEDLTIKSFINHFLLVLNDDTIIIKERLNVLIIIITLLYKYKLNELGIDTQTDLNKINNYVIKNSNYKAIMFNNINNNPNLNSIIFDYEISFPSINDLPDKTQVLHIIGSDNIIKEIWSRSL